MSVKIPLIILLIVTSSISIAQNKTFDKIEMFYDQGHYQKVYRKTDKLQKDPIFKDAPTVILFHALSEYQLSTTKGRFSQKKAIEEFENFLAHDSEQKFRKMYDIYIYDMQLGIVNEIRSLQNVGKSKEASVKYSTYKRLFGDGASFEMITKNEPIISTTDNVPESSSSNNREQIVDFAKQYLGTPYKYGGMDKNGFDCSGYTQFVMANNGHKIPRTAKDQSLNLEKIKITDAKKGDLLFFGSSKKNINHVGIVISDKGDPLSMIHASSSKGIMISNVKTDPYWSGKLMMATRVIED